MILKQLPIDFIHRMKTILKDEYDEFEKALSEEPVKGFRVNTDKISLNEFEKINIFGSEKIPYVDNGFYLQFDKIGNHPYHHAGMIYVQEPSAMAPAEAIDINKDWKILDMCAAPGGKSTQIKNKLGSNGVLVSNEIIMSRCKILTGNIERLGLKNCVTTCMDSNRLYKVFPNTFDMIMVDAPCSGEGMFRKEEKAVEEWSQQNVDMCATRQKQILNNAVSCLKNGGYIVYSTCTYSLEENEMVIDSFLKEHPEFEIIPVREEVRINSEDGIVFDGCTTENISFCRRFYPHKNRGEGQFVAVLHNKNESMCEKKICNKNRIADKIVTGFLDEVLSEYDKECVTTYGNTPVYFTPDFKVEKGVAFSCGVTIGEIRKNYIQPHHQFFMAMGMNFKKIIDLNTDSVRLAKFLHGEEFETECENGWAVVTVNKCPVGGVKISNGIAKNHYPKGLRTL